MVATIFLDIDGVLINRKSLRQASGLRSNADPDCVAELNRITDATGARIVVTSTWRRQGRRFVTDALRKWGVSGQVVGCTPVMSVPDRGNEIQAFIDAYRRPVGSFIIIDDDSDMLHLMPRLIRTNYEAGLTQADADRAIAMLQDQCQSTIDPGISVPIKSQTA
jgi:hypothetical protein